MSTTGDDFETNVIKPLEHARDHLHWLSVHRQHDVAGLLEEQVVVDLRKAYALKRFLVNAERPPGPKMLTTDLPYAKPGITVMGCDYALQDTFYDTCPRIVHSLLGEACEGCPAVKE